MIAMILAYSYLLRLLFILGRAIVAQRSPHKFNTDVEVPSDTSIAQIAFDSTRQRPLGRGVVAYVELVCLFGVDRVVHHQETGAQKAETNVGCDT